MYYECKIETISLFHISFNFNLNIRKINPLILKSKINSIESPINVKVILHIHVNIQKL